MNEKLKEKILEAFSSVVPITVIVLLLSIFVVPMPVDTIIMFLVGAGMLVVGMGLFTLGTDMAMMSLGEGIGAHLTKSRNLLLIITIAFIMGFVITIAEPDLTVLANQVPSIPNMTLVLTVAVGVGVFLVAAILRMLFKISLSKILIVLYGLVFLASLFVPADFLAVAFDSGGVTTGPITVPFIMAMGLGLTAVRSDKNAKDDSFGLVAMCSIGPILAVMILGIFYNPTEATYTPVTLPAVNTTQDVIREFLIELPAYFGEICMAILPIVGVLVIFQLITRRYQARQLLKICIGLVYTLIGLVLFLTGVNVGFIPVGHMIGSAIGGSFKWLLIPIGMVIGYYIVAAEPAVHVLNKQVEEVSNGAIPQSAMKLSLSIGVAVSLGLAMIRVITGISIYWFIVPGYLIALVLTKFVPPIFTGIAFDSGGVASGPMTSTFLLPFAMGACEAVGGNVMTDAFGIVAMVAMTPLIAVQLMGFAYSLKMKKMKPDEDIGGDADGDNSVMDYTRTIENELEH